MTTVTFQLNQFIPGFLIGYVYILYVSLCARLCILSFNFYRI